MVASSNNGVVNIRGKQYLTVARRVQDFREKHPLADGWAIVTQPVEITSEQVVFSASVVDGQGRTVATGHAQETWQSQINRTSAVENCETSAIGRALAAAGFGGEEFASANELQNAVRQQQAGHSNQPPKKLTRDSKDWIKRAEKRYRESGTVDSILGALDEIAANRPHFPDQDTFNLAINVVGDELDRFAPDEQKQVRDRTVEILTSEESPTPF